MAGRGAEAAHEQQAHGREQQQRRCRWRGSAIASGRPLASARRRAWAPANRQKMIQPFAKQARDAHADFRPTRPARASFMRSSRMPSRDQESQFQRLAGIEPRIAGGLVAVVQVDFLQALRAAQAFGDVLAGHLEMHAAGMGAFGAMDGEEAAHFFQDAVDRAGLVARLQLDGVAVHGIARPHHLRRLRASRRGPAAAAFRRSCRRRSGRSGSGGRACSAD